MTGSLPYLPEKLKGLEELALDLRWSWSHDLDELWFRVSPELWPATRNPWLALRSAGRSTLDDLAADEAFLTGLREWTRGRAREYAAPAWFGRVHPQTALRSVAYFSMEYGLSEALPLYSGGLGVLAGDYLKAASDLGVPIVALGILYQQGYFRQTLDAQGNQREYYPVADPDDLPILPVRDRDGKIVRLSIAFPGRDVFVRAWHARVGRVSLYLLDANDPENSPQDRGITSQLYGGDSELRLQQEIILGIGGWRLLDALSIDADVCHLNEGHAAFVVLERARALTNRDRVPFDVALTATRPGTIFTTHTPVAAGFDQFHTGMVERYLGRYATEDLGITSEALLALGRGPGDDVFMPARLALRGSGAVNGVSRRHGEVSRQLFAGLFPRWPLDEVPVGYVTNGVHTPSWDSVAADRVWTQACGKDRWRDDLSEIERRIGTADADDLWGMRLLNRTRLVEFVRERLTRQLRENGAPPDRVEAAQHAFDPNALTIGFARRFATYKRPLLLLHDEARFVRLLTNRERPVQIVVAGKAHPQDDAGKALVRAWAQFVRRDDVFGRAAFLSDYDLQLAEELVRGVDLWLNTPQPPWEASGTSGMKVLVNGGLNFSELDGWWPEAYAPNRGWALGLDGEDASDDAAANALYERLENEILPAFYTLDASDVPGAWVDRMRASMAELAPQFSANRMLREYVQTYYLGAAEAVRRRTADHCAVAQDLLEWQRSLGNRWTGIRFEEARIESDGTSYRYEVRCRLGELDPASVAVELYADARGARTTERHAMERTEVLDGGVALYRTVLDSSRDAHDYTPRAIPRHADAIVPLEAAEIVWQR